MVGEEIEEEASAKVLIWMLDCCQEFQFSAKEPTNGITYPIEGIFDKEKLFFCLLASCSLIEHEGLKTILPTTPPSEVEDEARVLEGEEIHDDKAVIIEASTTIDRFQILDGKTFISRERLASMVYKSGTSATDRLSNAWREIAKAVTENLPSDSLRQFLSGNTSLERLISVGVVAGRAPDNHKTPDSFRIGLRVQTNLDTFLRAVDTARHFDEQNADPYQEIDYYIDAAGKYPGQFLGWYFAKAGKDKDVDLTELASNLSELFDVLYRSCLFRIARRLDGMVVKAGQRGNRGGLRDLRSLVALCNHRVRDPEPMTGEEFGRLQKWKQSLVLPEFFMMGASLTWEDFLPDKLMLPAEYEDASYERLVWRNYGVVFSREVNRLLGSQATCEIDLLDGVYVPDIEDQHRATIIETRKRLSKNQNQGFWEAPKVRLAEDLYPARMKTKGKVALQETRYFSGVATNEFVNSQLYGGNVDNRRLILDGKSRFLHDARNVLLPLDSPAACSNGVGCSTLLLTRDGHVVITFQTEGNQQSGGLFAPSGSGSADYVDIFGKRRVRRSLNDFLCQAMERELVEECGLENMEKRGDLTLSTRVIGFARWLNRGGKPEFFGITVTNARSSDLAVKVQERLFIAGHLHDLKAKPSVVDLADYVNTVVTTKERSLSLPLYLNLLFFRDALGTPELGKEICADWIKMRDDG